jgi:polar amino acid transport system substrate-binding protein
MIIHMRSPPRLSVLLAALLLGACAAQTTLPTADEKASLTPTGKLRLAVLTTNPSYATKDPATGELKGPSIEVGRRVAERLGVPMEIVPYGAIGAMIASATKGEWDLVASGINPERQKVVEFAAPHAMSESGYLAKGATPSSIAEVDRAGVRVVVLERGDSDIFLTQLFKNATLVRAKTQAEANAALNEGKADVHANTKTNLFPAAKQVPGSRILDGYWQVQPIAFGVPKNKEASARFVKRMVDEMKASGAMREIVVKAAVPGLAPAP